MKCIPPIGSFGQKKVQVSSSTYLGKGANLLFSASTFNDSGQSLFLEEADSPDTNFGVADGVDKERGYDTFANLIWRDWEFYRGGQQMGKPRPSRVV